MVSDIPAGGGNIAHLFYSEALCHRSTHPPSPWSSVTDFPSTVLNQRRSPCSHRSAHAPVKAYVFFLEEIGLWLREEKYRLRQMSCWHTRWALKSLLPSCSWGERISLIACHLHAFGNRSITCGLQGNEGSLTSLQNIMEKKHPH